jgi:hypothetical protein
VDAFVSVMKSLKDLRFSVESGSVVIEPVVEEPVVASVGVVDGEEIEVVDFESEIDFVEVKKKK